MIRLLLLFLFFSTAYGAIYLQDSGMMAVYSLTRAQCEQYKTDNDLPYSEVASSAKPIGCYLDMTTTPTHTVVYNAMVAGSSIWYSSRNCKSDYQCIIDDQAANQFTNTKTLVASPNDITPYQCSQYASSRGLYIYYVKYTSYANGCILYNFNAAPKVMYNFGNSAVLCNGLPSSFECVVAQDPPYVDPNPCPDCPTCPDGRTERCIKNNYLSE